jgi:cytochrome c oxidase subunit 1
MLPAMGMVSEILSINSRKPIFGYIAMVGSMFAIAALSFHCLGSPHVCYRFKSILRVNIYVLFTLLIALPSAIKVFNWLTTLWRGSIRFTPAMLFAIGFVSMFISGGLTGIWLGNSALDIHLHDTYFVILLTFILVMGVASILECLQVYIIGFLKCMVVFNEYIRLYPFLDNYYWCLLNILANALRRVSWYAKKIL